MNSGMKPNLIRSTGCACDEQVDIPAPADARTAAALLLFLQEAHGLLAGAPRDHLLQTHERAAADEQDVGGIHGREFLVRMLAPALRRNVGHRSFQDLQQRLLHALARDVAGDRRVFVLAADLVDLVDIDDALLALLHVAIGRLQQLQDDVLDVLAHVAGFGQGGGVHDGERHVQDLGQRLRHQGLAGAGGADQQDIGLLQLHVGVAHAVHVNRACSGCRRPPPASSWWLPARSRTDPETPSLPRLGDLVGSSGGRLDLVVLQNRVADRDALVADVRAGVVARRGNQLADYVLALMAKRTPQSIIGSGTLHAVFSSSAGPGRDSRTRQPVGNLNPISSLLSPERAPKQCTVGN